MPTLPSLSNKKNIDINYSLKNDYEHLKKIINFNKNKNAIISLDNNIKTNFNQQICDLYNSPPKKIIKDFQQKNYGLNNVYANSEKLNRKKNEIFIKDFTNNDKYKSNLESIEEKHSNFNKKYENNKNQQNIFTTPNPLKDRYAIKNRYVQNYSYKREVDYVDNKNSFLKKLFILEKQTEKKLKKIKKKDNNEDNEENKETDNDNDKEKHIKDLASQFEDF